MNSTGGDYGFGEEKISKNKNTNRSGAQGSSLKSSATPQLKNRSTSRGRKKITDSSNASSSRK